MSVTKQPDGRWLVCCRPSGVNGPHIRRTVKTKTEGVYLERQLMSKATSSMDNAYLSACAESWFDHWGINLKDGERRYRKLKLIIRDMGDFRLSRLTPSVYLDYRKERLNKGISANTCNHDLVYLKTMINKLKRSKYVSNNPLEDISPLKIDDFELTFLTSYQIKRLLVAARNSMNESLFPVVCLCLATGARWSEAEKLRFDQIGWQTVRFTKTKNGKSRTVPVDERIFKMLQQRRFLGQGRVFANCYSAFRHAVSRAKIHLPKGQMAHVLRHTFASHFVMNGGDILTLQKILDHSDLKVTMRYAHLSPDHLRDAVKLNPISTIFK